MYPVTLPLCFFDWYTASWEKYLVKDRIYNNPPQKKRKKKRNLSTMDREEILIRRVANAESLIFNSFQTISAGQPTIVVVFVFCVQNMSAFLCFLCLLFVNWHELLHFVDDAHIVNYFLTKFEWNISSPGNNTAVCQSVRRLRYCCIIPRQRFTKSHWRYALKALETCHWADIACGKVCNSCREE
jgi:hypothetical protein